MAVTWSINPGLSASNSSLSFSNTICSLADSTSTSILKVIPLAAYLAVSLSNSFTFESPVATSLIPLYCPPLNKLNNIGPKIATILARIIRGPMTIMSLDMAVAAKSVAFARKPVATVKAVVVPVAAPAAAAAALCAWVYVIIVFVRVPY